MAVLLGVLVTASCARDAATRKRAFYESGNAYFAHSRFDEAIIQYRNALEIDPLFTEARLTLAEAYARRGDRANAVAQYVRAADFRPDDARLQVTAGNYLLAAGRPREALARADAVLATNARNASAHVLRGNALTGVQNVDSAVTEIERAIQLEPNGRNAYASLGLIELTRGRQAQAEAALQKAVALAPEWTVGYLALGNFYLAASREADARSAFAKALALDPENSVANRAMAVLAITDGRPADAEPFLRRVASAARPWAVLALADYYLAAGRPRDAVVQLDRVKHDPRVASKAAPRLVGALAATGDRTRAHGLADALLARNGRDSAARLARAQLLLQEGRQDEAFADLRVSVEADSRQPLALLLLGKLYAARGEVAAAEAAFTTLLRQSPRAAAAHLELSRLYLASSRQEASVASAREALSLQPGNIDARLTLVNALVAAGEIAEADERLRNLLAEHPENAVLHLQRGLIAVRRDDLRAARAAFEGALRRDPGLADALGGLVSLDLHDGERAEAAARVDAALRTHNSPAVRLVAARTYAATGDFTRAEKLLRTTLEWDPMLLPAYGMLGHLYAMQGRLPEARRQFAALAARQPRPVAAFTVLGVLYQIEGDLSAARAQFEKALAIDDRAAVAANNLAWIHAESGEQLDVALQLARTAVAGLPQSAEASDTLGWVLYRKEMPSLAIKPFQQAAERDPGNPLYQYHLGLALAGSGQNADARRALRHAMSLKPGSEEARHAREALEALARRGRP